ncbi:thioredoxin 1 [Balnearium lithotrophicum]|uniref:Thioredoxin 1 n=1 Tax=Balnearium lithotrophicum TaxID=223788 RepID=A0A521ADD7_9BACT|nr:thioredoxin family protein [Balnearium lithotrophicum]SMO32825.1 thioredoxin 1 [Balnearium lithotrophicum]
MSVPESLLKVAAIFFDIIFVLLVAYVVFIFGIRIFWSFKSKRLKGKELPETKEFLRLKKGKGVIYIYAPNCKPCKLVDPVIKKLSKEIKGVPFVRINAAEDVELVRKLGVLATPTVIITERGRIREILIGPVTEGTIREKLK